MTHHLHERAVLPWWIGKADDLAHGFAPDDDRGTEDIDLSDCGFTAVVTPAGLLNGLVAVSLVAGACNQRYLQLWRAAA